MIICKKGRLLTAYVKEKRKTANCICKRKKREWLNDKNKMKRSKQKK
jgi:hypothetical protein